MTGEIAFYRPSSIEDACSVMCKNPTFIPVAGGTDLVVKHRNGILKQITGFVDIGVLGLNGIRTEDGFVIIGATTTMADIASSGLIKDRFPALATGARGVGAPQIRSMATLGGNVANASPAGDSIPPLVSLDAEAVLAGVSGTRVVTVMDLLKGPGRTALSEGEFITEFRIPDQKTNGVFIKLGARRAHAISKVSIAVSVWEHDSRKVFGVAYGAAGPVVIRARKTEEILGAARFPVPTQAIENAGKAAMIEVRPISDLRSSEAYRRKMAATLLTRAFEELRAC